MLEQYSIQRPQGDRARINEAYRIDEFKIMSELIEKASLNNEQNNAIRNKATQLVEQVRSERKKSTGIDSFLTQYSLSSEEGIANEFPIEARLKPANERRDPFFMKSRRLLFFMG